MKTYGIKKDKCNDLLEHREINLSWCALGGNMLPCPTFCDIRWKGTAGLILGGHSIQTLLGGDNLKRSAE